MTLRLSQGHVAIIDAHDAERVGRHSWHAVKAKKTFYARTQIEGRAVYLHRFVVNAEPGRTVDHVNHDGLDCRKENLRLATMTEQNANQRKRAGGSSRFKGVHQWVNRGKIRWRAGVQISGRQYRVSCATEHEAALAYNRLARQHFGQFAALNDVGPAC